MRGHNIEKKLREKNVKEELQGTNKHFENKNI